MPQARKSASPEARKTRSSPARKTRRPASPQVQRLDSARAMRQTPRDPMRDAAMPEPSLFDAGPFAPCPAPFNMAAHTFAPSARAPERLALEVIGPDGARSESWTHGRLAETVRRTAGGLAALSSFSLR